MEAMTKALDPDISAAIASAAAGDDLAFGRIVATHHNEMYSICVVICRDRPLAEEAVQAAWSIVWKKLGSVREPERLRDQGRVLAGVGQHEVGQPAPEALGPAEKARTARLRRRQDP